MSNKTKFYQASTSELFGEIQESKQSEKLNFIQEVLTQHQNYLHIGLLKIIESYNMFASNGILFNHESPRRGETFVTRKITIGISKIIYGLENCLLLEIYIH